MILTGNAILAAVHRGAIRIDPFSVDCINPNSYNYHLGNEIYEVCSSTLDIRNEPKLKKLRLTSGGYFILRPEKLYLGVTKEVIGSKAYMTSLIGRSSIGRLGMYLQITADLGQLGNAHRWTLEIEVVVPLRVYPGMSIGQVSFWAVDGAVDYLYTEGYTSFDKPHAYRRALA